jgi:eukaryotic-like serine/threonine-protein kinase
MGLRRFLISKAFLKHLIIAFAIFFASVFIIFTGLKIYTRHGESFPVPSLHGMTEHDFSRVLEKSHLQYIITDSTYVEGIPAGGVIDQVPDAGHRVKRSRTIFITINAVAPEQVTIPPLTDISMRQSISQIESAGLLPGDIIYKPSEFHNLVLQAIYNGYPVVTGQKIAKGSRIDLVVGTGLNQGTVGMPYLRGLTLEMARLVIADSMLNIGAVIYDQSVMNRFDSLNARIWKQNPDRSATRYINIGTSVDIWLTLDENRLFEEHSEEPTGTEPEF